MNDVTLSDDHRWMTIRSGDRKAQIKSARPDGFTEDDVEYARDRYEFIPALRQGQVDRTFRKGAFFFHVNTGPPWWWWPRVQIRRNQVMVGWLKALVAIRYAPRRTGAQ